jgi:hypothetical protein
MALNRPIELDQNSSVTKTGDAIQPQYRSSSTGEAIPNGALNDNQINALLKDGKIQSQLLESADNPVLIAGAGLGNRKSSTAQELGGVPGMPNRTYDVVAAANTFLGTGGWLDDGDRAPGTVLNRVALEKVSSLNAEIKEAANAYQMYPMSVAAILFEEYRRRDSNDFNDDKRAFEAIKADRGYGDLNDRSIGAFQIKPDTLEQVVQAGWLNPNHPAFANTNLPPLLREFADKLSPQTFPNLDKSEREEILVKLLMDPKSAAFCAAASLAWMRNKDGNTESFGGTGNRDHREIQNSAQYSALTQQFSSLDQAHPTRSPGELDADTSTRNARGYLADRNYWHIKNALDGKPGDGFNGW